MTGAFTGEGKTDARDAVVIAQSARLRGDLAQVSVPDDLATELELLTGHRRYLVDERTRGINRLRVLLTRIFPGLERCFDYSTLTGLAFVTKYVTPVVDHRSLRRGDLRSLAYSRGTPTHDPENDLCSSHRRAGAVHRAGR